MFLGPEGRKQMMAAGSVAAIGFELVIAICIGHFGGRWLDTRFHTDWIQWVGLVFGLVAGFRSLYRLARKYSSASAAAKRTAEPTDEHDPRNPS
jgi:F0F1-type ATP synthase assembly protein I